MRNSTITKLFLAALTLSGGALGIAYADTPLQDEQRLPSRVKPAIPYLDYFFSPENGGSIVLTVKAPLVDENGAAINGNIGTLRLMRSCTDTGEAQHVIKEWSDVKPGTSLEFTDTEVTPGTTYTYYVQAIIGLDSSEVFPKDIAAIVRPDRVTDIDIYTNFGNAPITISGMVPSTQVGGYEYPAGVTTTYIRITRGVNWTEEPFVEVAKLTGDKVKPGEPFTFEDKDPTLTTGKEYVYLIYAGCDWGESYSERRTVSLGLKEPVAPGNVKAVLSADGKKATVTWDAPVSGKDNTYIDQDELRYDLYRVYNDYEEVLLAEDLTDELEYVDEFEDLDRERSFTYQVVATNDLGSSERGISNSITAGPAYSIPFYESFNTRYGTMISPECNWDLKTVDNGGVTKFGLRELSSIYISSIDDYYQIRGAASRGTYGEEGSYEDGFASMDVIGPIWGECDFTSSPITMKGAEEPMLYFKYYNIPGNQSELRMYVEPYGASLTPDNWVGDYVEISDSKLPAGWHTGSFDLSTIKNLETVRIRINGKVTKGNSPNYAIIVDEIALYDKTKAVKARGAVYDEKSNEIVVLEDFYQPAKSYDIYVDGDLVGNTTNGRIKYTEKVGQTVDIRIVSHHANGTTAEAEFKRTKLDGSGVETVLGDTTLENVEYFNMQGMRIDNPEKGQIVIMRGTTADGKVKSFKTVVR